MARSDIYKLVNYLKGGGANLELFKKVRLTRKSHYRQFCVVDNVEKFI